MSAILKFNGANVLHLGMVDEGAFQHWDKNERKPYFKYYHHQFFGQWFLSNKDVKFRGEAEGEWVKPKKIKGNDISSLQAFLSKYGFMPFAEVDGVFGYKTLASVRLFQEYVRTMQDSAIGTPDGRVGAGTHNHMMRWKQEGNYCEWGPRIDPDNPFVFPMPDASSEYVHWLNLLKKTTDDFARQMTLAEEEHFETNMDLFKFRELNQFNKSSDSRKLSEWTFNSNDIHLIGIRCHHDDGEHKRGNDDLFVLLMNGHVFKFWGSTDPKPSASDNSVSGFEPYLIEGQHRYKFGWHYLGSRSHNKVYKALKPATSGVLVFRDWDNDNSLTPQDIKLGLKANPSGKSNLENPNNTINIHWTGNGHNNWSAGCQVISGKSYINHKGKLIDCSGFSALGNRDLSAVSKPGVRKTRGAYNFLADFVLAYAGSRKEMLYTLGRDGTVTLYGDDRLMETLASQEVLTHIQGYNKKEEGIQKLVKVLSNPTHFDGVV